MYAFVLKASGGASGHLLKNTEAFVRSRAQGTSLTPEFYKAISVDLKQTDQHVLTRHALLKAAFVHQCVDSRNCRSALQDPVSEKMMKRLREITQDNTHETDVKNFIEEADVRIVCHQIGCKLECYQQFTKINGLMHAMINELSEVVGVPIAMHEFADEAETSKPSASTIDKQKQDKQPVRNMFTIRL